MPDELQKAAELIINEAKNNQNMYFALVNSVYSAIHEMPDELFEKDAARYIVDRLLGFEKE